MSTQILLAGRLIDGTGAEPLERMALLLRDGRIAAVVRQSDLTPSQRQDAEVRDLGSATVLPGLIDTHVHLTFNAGRNHAVVREELERSTDVQLALRSIGNGQAHLAAGVTTVRDTGGRGFVTLPVRDAIHTGVVAGPRVLACGPAITTPGGHLNYLQAIAANAAELREWSQKVLDTGADFVKLCATGGVMTSESDPMHCQYTTEELCGAVEVAEARNTLVAAHALSAESVRRCIAAGVRSIEHCMWQETLGNCVFDPQAAAEMRKKNIFAGITFAGLSQARYWAEVLGREPLEDFGPWRGRMEARYEAERQMIESGVRYVLHSDAGVRETPFGAFWLILATACFELHLTPLEAIRACTSSAAELLGIAGEVGTIEPGKHADLLVVEGNPAEKIEALQKPSLVLQDGRVVAEGGCLSAAWNPANRL